MLLRNVTIYSLRAGIDLLMLIKFMSYTVCVEVWGSDTAVLFSRLYLLCSFEQGNKSNMLENVSVNHRCVCVWLMMYGF